jgi:hypothetical protein
VALVQGQERVVEVAAGETGVSAVANLLAWRGCHNPGRDKGIRNILLNFTNKYYILYHSFT